MSRLSTTRPGSTSPGPSPFFTEILPQHQLPAAGPELLVALDIDGTTLRHDTSLSARVKDAVHAHIAAGTRLIFATGRGIAGTQEALHAIGIEHGIVVACNGTITCAIGNEKAPQAPVRPKVLPNFLTLDTPPYRLLNVHTFNPQQHIDILHAGLPESVWYAVETVDEPTRVTYPFPPEELSGPSQLVPISDLASDKATRLTVRAPHMSAQELLVAVADLGLHGVEYAVGWSAWMDITPEGISKASALEDIRRRYGIAAQHTVCVGDSGNDVDMLGWAGLGIAMGNAPDYVRDAAHGVTNHVDDDGCAAVLEALL